MNSTKNTTFRISLISGMAILFLFLLPVLFPMTGTPGSNGVAAMGRFHILTLHFPIALVLLIPLLELLCRTRRLSDLSTSIYPLLVLATLSSFAASGLGFMLMHGDGFSGTLVTDHMRGGILTCILLLITLLLKKRYLYQAATPIQAAYFTTLGLSLIALISTSHHGASLVHGTDYLYEKLPPLFGTSTPNQAPLSKESNAYHALIQPIFRAHCYDCHSADKSKGGYRMDDFELLLSGGDGGMPGIEPGDLEESEVHYRITLLPTQKAFMPPGDHLPLTPEQTELISWWIESGASAEASMADLLQSHPDEGVQNLLD